MNNYFVILAAGKSKRFHKKIPKQFYYYRNKEIIEHSIEKSSNSRLFKKIVVVTNNLNHFKKKKIHHSVKVIKGGKERSDSSLIALKFITKYKPTKKETSSYDDYILENNENFVVINKPAGILLY